MPCFQIEMKHASLAASLLAGFHAVMRAHEAGATVSVLTLSNQGYSRSPIYDPIARGEMGGEEIYT